MKFQVTALLSRWYGEGRLSQYLLLIASLGGVVGLLLTARAFVALAPVAAVVAALLNPGLRRQWGAWLRNGAARRAAALYLLIPLSWWYTQDWPIWRHEVYRQLPLIGAPLAFTLAVPLSARQRFSVGMLFVAGASLIGLATVGRYLLDPVAAQHLINTGQNVPAVTGIFHIHFGIILALAAFFALFMSRERLVSTLSRWLLLGCAVASAACLHVLAYRTGLLAFYLALGLVALFLLFKRPLVAVGLVVLCCAVALGAFKFVEPVQVRVYNTWYDLHQYQHGYDINDFSLSRRLAAWHNAGLLIQRQPVLGVAPADVRSAMMAQFEYKSFGLKPENRVMVHNQYLHYLVGAGIVGLLVWLWVLFTPLAQPRQRRNPYVKYFLLVFGAAALADSLLELQIGFNLFVFLYGFLVVAGERRVAEGNVTR